MSRLIFSLFFLLFHPAIYGLAVTSGITSISGPGTHTNPEIAVSSGGTAMAIWTQAFPNRVETAFFNGLTWLPPVILANGSFPKVSIDANGNAIAVWLNTANNQVLSSRFNAASITWSTPIQLSTGGINAAPQVAVNASGNALAIWVLSSPIRIVASIFNASTFIWSTPVALVSGTGSFPQVGLDNSNNGIVMWTDTQFGIEAITVAIP